MSQISFIKAMLEATWRDRRFSAEDIVGIQQSKLRRLVQSSRRDVPFQAVRLQDISLNDIDLTRIPPTDKSTMMARFDETIRNGEITRADVQRAIKTCSTPFPVIDGGTLISKTSGTTGTPAVFVTDVRSWSRLRGATFARTMRNWLGLDQLLRFGTGRRCRIAFLAPDDKYCATKQVALAPLSFGKLMTSMTILSIAAKAEENVRQLNALQPHYLHAYPTVLLHLVHAAGEKIRFQPEVISFGSETLTQSAEAQLREMFPTAQLIVEYGTTECIPMAHWCEQQKLHVNSDYCILEPVAADGRLMTDGAEFSDHVLLTNLENCFQPLIRYRVDDAIRIDPAPCSCGRPFPVIELQGRSGGCFFFQNEAGDWIELSEIQFVGRLLCLQPVAQYQVIHERQNQLRVRYSAHRGSDLVTVGELICTTVDQLLESRGLEKCVSVVAEPVTEFERVGTGEKLRQLVSLVDPPSKNSDFIGSRS